MNPRRIQRQRAKGWRMPEGAVYVGRPTRWGNPYEREAYVGYYSPTEIPRLMVSDYRGWLEGRFDPDRPGRSRRPTVEDVRRELRGKDLVCWCVIGEPCHADVLLELANGS
jgi:hypothetical protein